MKEKISRWCEDTFYTLLIHLRNILLRLHILRSPLPPGVKTTMTEQDIQAHLDLLEMLDQAH
ncbi:MAG: hypothetical protein ACRDIV_13880 [Ktedonobacteraceae bacterium]